MRVKSVRLVPRAKLWLEVDGQVALSDWRVGLLAAIEETGSLKRAASPGTTASAAGAPRRRS